MTDEATICNFCFSALDVNDDIPVYDTNGKLCVKYMKCSTCTMMICTHCFFRFNHRGVERCLAQRYLPGNSAYPLISTEKFPCLIKDHEFFTDETKRSYSVCQRNELTSRNAIKPLAIIQFLLVVAYMNYYHSSTVVHYNFISGNLADADSYFHYLKFLDSFWIRTEFFISLVTILLYFRYRNQENAARFDTLQTSTNPFIPAKDQTDNTLRELVNFKHPTTDTSDFLSRDNYILRLSTFLEFFIVLYLGDNHAIYDPFFVRFGAWVAGVMLISSLFRLRYDDIVKMWRNILRAISTRYSAWPLHYLMRVWMPNTILIFMALFFLTFDLVRMVGCCVKLYKTTRHVLYEECTILYMTINEKERKWHEEENQEPSV